MHARIKLNYRFIEPLQIFYHSDKFYDGIAKIETVITNFIKIFW